MRFEIPILNPPPTTSVFCSIPNPISFLTPSLHPPTGTKSYKLTGYSFYCTPYSYDSLVIVKQQEIMAPDDSGGRGASLS